MPSKNRYRHQLTSLDSTDTNSTSHSHLKNCLCIARNKSAHNHASILTTPCNIFVQITAFLNI